MATTQDRLYDVLLTRVREDRYPSHQLLNRIEELIYTPEQIVEYCEVLTDKIDETWYPSHQLIGRAQRMMASVNAAHQAIERQRQLEQAAENQED